MDISDLSARAATADRLGIGGATPVAPAEVAGGRVSDGRPAAAAASSSFSSVARAMNQAMQVPEVRADRVASLQQKIASGDYQVDPHAVATAILRDLSR